VIVWDSFDQTAHPERVGVYGRSFTSAGAAQSTDFAVREKPRDAFEIGASDVAHIGTAGEFVVVWQEGSSTLTGRRFRPGS
jgi:hypothetical protein